jgi:glycosyltransferase involved in cell wall biosynthesis
MSELIRVAQVVGRMMGGGVEATVMNHYRHIDHSRIQFDFIVQNDSTVVPEDEIKALGGRVFTIPSYKHLSAYINACEQLFCDLKPTIVHSHMNALSVFPLGAAKRAGVPVRIAHSHSTSNPREYTKTAVKMALRPFAKVYPTHYAACSHYTAQWLFGEKLDAAGKVRIIRNAIEPEIFRFNPMVRAAKRAELGVADNQLLIGQVGRMCFQKNQLFTLDVFKQVLECHPNAVLALAGDGDMMKQVQARIHELGLERSVRMLGVRNDISSLYQALDVLAFPSTHQGADTAVRSLERLGLNASAPKGWYAQVTPANMFTMSAYTSFFVEFGLIASVILVVLVLRWISHNHAWNKTTVCWLLLTIYLYVQFEGYAFYALPLLLWAVAAVPRLKSKREF